MAFPEPTVALAKTIRSFVYWQYADDDDVQAWVEAYNQNTQEYVDWFNALNLPIYTKQSGTLLDWVALGLYGLPRPVLGTGNDLTIGAWGTYVWGGLAYAEHRVISRVVYSTASDDVFKRVITWHFFKGDGRVFTVRWLKRRIMRFLVGTNGTAPIVDQTYLISVTFGADGQINIRLITQFVKITGGCIYGQFAWGEQAYGALQRRTVATAPEFALAQVFREALLQGVLEIPFQFHATVQTNGSFTLPADGGFLRPPSG